MRRLFFVAFVALWILPTSMLSAVTAQEATPADMGSGPITDVCSAPEILPGTPTAFEELFPEDAAEATPVGGGVAAPALATPEPVSGEPADEDVAAEVEAAIHNLATCINNGQYVEYAALHTPNALIEDCGTTNPYDGEWCFGGTPFIEVLEITNIQVLDDGRYSAEATYQMGNMLAAEQFIFVQRDEFLLLDASPELPVDVPEDATAINGEMTEFEFILSDESAPAGSIVFNVTNTGEYTHELVMVQLPEGVTIDDVFADEALFEQVQFQGFTFAGPGEEAKPLVLVDMEPGTYTIVCFVDEPDGVPHVMEGMILEFEVTEQ